ncbi:hypothetical protein ACM46_09790 [Chryseobacterium angstadtii]|uniref:Uncharacterized protein n=1 Tax=Chryseobacterium angstadtii TaxID=558151 RepID=A0A0J7IEV5_9FLAO|nr:hypothetical protein ACM46_09790 [Chryseobacterium angstadtii]
MAKKEKKQLHAKRIQASPANSSKWVFPLILVIFSEVMISRENPKRLLDALRMWGDFFSIIYNFLQYKTHFFYYQIFKKNY